MVSRLQSGSHKYHVMTLEGYAASGMIFQQLSEVLVKNITDIRGSDSSLNYREILADYSTLSNKSVCKCSESISPI